MSYKLYLTPLSLLTLLLLYFYHTPYPQTTGFDDNKTWLSMNKEGDDEEDEGDEEGDDMGIMVRFTF